MKEIKLKFKNIFLDDEDAQNIMKWDTPFIIKKIKENERKKNKNR